MNSSITPPVEQVVTIQMTVREAQVLKSYLASLNWASDEAAKRLQMYSRVERAWNDPGRFPVYHERAKDKLRERWPALSNPLDVL